MAENQAGPSSQSDVMDSWLERKRRERAEEVNRVAQFAAKDIGDRRAAIEAFMSPDAASTEGSSSSANQASEEEQPSAVVVEITGLFHSRPVSSILQSAQFRRRLESVVRANMPSSSASLRSGGSSQRSQSPAPSIDSTISSQSDQTSVVNANVVLPRAVNRPATPVAMSRRSTVAMSTPAAQVAIPTAAIPPPPPLPNVVPAVANPIAPHFERLIDDQEEIILDLNRENLIQDISELVHRSLVSNVLESDFRDVLENSMMQHLEHTQSDGQRSLQALRALQPVNRIRNDFRHLGIIRPQEQIIDDDSISIISATARTVPINETPSASAREIRSLREEMRDMKATIRLLMDAQMETQRCIRQELSAALHGNEQAVPPTPAANGGNCLICLTKPSDTLLYRCGHLCMCYTCSIELRHHQNAPTCPVCRAPVVDAIRVYAVGTTPDQ